MGNKFKLITLNARGIKNDTKRRKFLKFIKQQNPQILSLQETNITENYDFIQKQSGALDSTWTKHTAILLYTDQFSMTKLTEIEERAIVVDLIPKGESDPVLRVVSIYAPAQRIKRPSFYANLLNDPLIQYSDHPIILMGDFNFDFFKT